MSYRRIDTPALRHTFPLHELFPGARKVAEGRYRAPCPFHGGSNAQALSIAYRGDRGWVYYCHNCQASGDAIRATMQLRQVPFARACELLGGLDELGAPSPAVKVPQPLYVLACDAPGCTERKDVWTELDRAVLCAGGSWQWEVAPDGVGALCWRHGREPQARPV